ncbi:hypothetical protein [Jannaschia sp. R86511]|uniref:hypothetical protein n=1 Tax=Jannaschia sp. R86511 TaxID=3093853 RepID=UPI0036D3FB7B
MTDPATVLRALGRPATFAELMRHTTRRALRTALGHGTVVRLCHDRYVPAPDRDGLGDRARAVRAGGALSHLSAAVSHGWGVLRPPDGVQMTVPPTSNRSSLPGVQRYWAPLSPQERETGVTEPVRTAVDCARTLPLPEALAVVDSALRSGLVPREELLDAATATRSPGARRARLVARHADERAANAFESGLRGLLVADGLTAFVPQLVVAEPGLFAVVDLGDPEARVALEADGHGVHGTRHAFAADLRRHDDLQSAGWVTRRFAWEHVMFDGAWVVAQVRSAYRERPRRRRTRA